MANQPGVAREDFQEELSELESAEDFLDFFGVEYDPAVVHVNRLHILQRFHVYLAQAQLSMPAGLEAQWAVHFKLLARAYQDFVESDALTEKVFKVFHTHGDCHAFVPLDQLSTPSENPPPPASGT